MWETFYSWYLWEGIFHHELLNVEPYCVEEHQVNVKKNRTSLWTNELRHGENINDKSQYFIFAHQLVFCMRVCLKNIGVCLVFALLGAYTQKRNFTSDKLTHRPGSCNVGLLQKQNV